MDRFLKRALDLAVQNVQEGGQPFGAVLVRNGEIVAEGANELHKTYDVSGHAELIAVRKAQQQLQTNQLSGFTMYASGEPCPMCLTAMYYAGIEEVFFCQSVEDAVEAGLGTSKLIYEELGKNKEDRQMKMTQIKLADGAPNPLTLWKQRKYS